MSLENKINKIEPFNLDRVANDFNSGRINSFSAIPDFNDAHMPHVDLNVTFPNQQQTKYRIYDTTGTSNLLNDFGPNGLSLKR